DQDVGSGLGRAYWIDGAWHIVYGNTAFSDVSAEPPPTVCPGLVRGDVNADGKITLGDVILSLRAVVGLDPISIDCVKRSIDVDCDRVLTVGDVTLRLGNFVLGEPLPACG